MYFMNEDHAYNFQNMILQDKTHVNDRERFALFYILGGNEDLFLKRSHVYDFKLHEINPDVLTNAEVDFCSSSKALIRLAYNLYNGHEDSFISPHDLFRTLDSRNYLIAKGAIDMRFGRDIEEQMNEGVEEEMEIEFL
ncbi:DUF6075 family protein [Fusibacter sp. 3D3]|uniref:DUF6075 family protein n=1 Tax=Fusibacter sp. 3D3 TaxID=1048380 RepID=UPI0008532FE1|nr:DUF6075 family protein [Fusibacter sp. 3D3]GAU79583.1 hypothetical protein F3D3_4247 [Fusibacter sp. 3D3]